MRMLLGRVADHKVCVSCWCSARRKSPTCSQDSAKLLASAGGQPACISRPTANRFRGLDMIRLQIPAPDAPVER